MGDDWTDRWKHIQKLLERSGPFAEADFEPSSEVTLSDVFVSNLKMYLELEVNVVCS